MIMPLALAVARHLLKSLKGKFQMTTSRYLWPRLAFLVATVLSTSGHASAQAQYVVANDDFRINFYTEASNGALTQFKYIVESVGGVGGYFGANRIQALNSGGQQCEFASIAGKNEILGISMSSLTVASSASGSPTDDGSANGIGLAGNSQYLYAAFTSSNTIATFAVQPGCGLAFVGDVSVAGLAGGMVNGMAIHGNMMIATFTDGTIQSFDLSGVTPISNDDAKYSTGTFISRDATYPNSIDITRDGHYAIFGDTSSSMVVEVSDISSGHLRPTWVYRSGASISSSNVMLSPDESLLYVVNTQGASVSAYLFDKKTGRLTLGCTSPPIRGQSSQWSYLGAPGLINQTGSGGGVYVAEFGAPSGIAMVALQSSKYGRCSLQETTQSPFPDNGLGLITIGTFPPRAF
jgi:hypothetical protein